MWMELWMGAYGTVLYVHMYGDPKYRVKYELYSAFVSVGHGRRWGDWMGDIWRWNGDDCNGLDKYIDPAAPSGLGPRPSAKGRKCR